MTPPEQGQEPPKSPGADARPASRDAAPERDRAGDGRKDDDGPERDGNADAEGRETADDPADGEQEKPQRAWDTRREILRHSPGIMLGRKSAVGGSVAGHDLHGVSGGHVAGDVYLGGRTEYHVAADGPVHASGEIRAAELDRMAAVFTRGEDDAGFAEALERLRSERIVVLTGAPSTGRRLAALMLLREVGAVPVRVLDPTVAPGKLRDQLTGGHGYALCDLAAGRERPLREHHLRAVADELRSGKGYLVITAEGSAVQAGPPPVPWRQPALDAMLRCHLQRLVEDPEATQRLLALPAAADFLRRDHRPGEVARFAHALADHHAGRTTPEDLEQFSRAAVRDQVREWFDDAELLLHDKAFLVSLAAFDGTPFPLTAELGDTLYALLQRTENPDESPRIPVFSTSTAQRLELARAETREQREDTEWGPVHQRTAHFRNPSTSLELLREVWTGHPSSRPGLLAWLRRLAEDGRPLVRTRAAATAAVLASADLPSAMALLIGPWALARQHRLRVAAVTALTLMHTLGTPNVPQILREWSTDPRPAMRWTAVRTYAVAGEDFPQEALSALIDAVRAADDGSFSTDARQELDEIAESAAMLLLAGTEGNVLPDLVPLLTEPRPVRSVVQQAFVLACTQTDGGDESGRPVLLDRYAGTADDAEGTPGAAYRHGLTALWRAVLNDRTRTRDALEVLRSWVRLADRDEGAEWSLAWLLHTLVATGDDRERLVHMLRNLRGTDGGPQPEAAGRLLAYLTAANPPQTPHVPHPSRPESAPPARPRS
ncbi:hypothetical protein RM572_25030 [Streptomyces sp. DSM 42041]|uniref:Uncharacterized protein n=1 Tax=Streptomyces hazeniae TaxID=3075538 RepID=A0ABU2NYG4_9ACTN|nr:hypothetical protein [Streptomyces sp. DSM 42041]MDT0382032.1 hypothetical protein [Streptomyces sp. DSM 42041]